MKPKLLFVPFCLLMFFLMDKPATAQVKPGKTIVPEKIENAITVKPAVKKMQPALTEDPWEKHKLETYSKGSEESNVLNSEKSENNLNVISVQDNKTDNHQPKDSRKSTRVKIAGEKKAKVPSGK